MHVSEEMIRSIVKEVMAKMQSAEGCSGKHGVFKDMNEAIAAAKEDKSLNVLILERDSELGGILNQCIHNGFGLHRFGEELSGPEYADRFVKLVENEDIDVMLESMVLRLTADKKVEVDEHEAMILRFFFILSRTRSNVTIVSLIVDTVVLVSALTTALFEILIKVGIFESRFFSAR